MLQWLRHKDRFVYWSRLRQPGQHHGHVGQSRRPRCVDVRGHGRRRTRCSTLFGRLTWNRAVDAVLVLLAITVAALSSLGLVAGASARPAQEPQPVTLRIIFPEGFSARQMADRVSTVRRIAIDRRGVTPRLTGVA
jgi:hypothetical protein